MFKYEVKTAAVIKAGCQTKNLIATSLKIDMPNAGNYFIIILAFLSTKRFSTHNYAGLIFLCKYAEGKHKAKTTKDIG